jgi:CHASE2 domain-containing sensor protein
LQQYQPAAIGFDLLRDLPVEPGGKELAILLRTSPNLIVSEIAGPDLSGQAVKPPSGIPTERVGAVDFVLDDDGALRRNLLGASYAKQFHFSFAIRLTEKYLKEKYLKDRPDLHLQNGTRDPAAMQIGETELTRVQPDTGGYINADARGNQILLNFRSGRTPFKVISISDIKAGKGADWIRDRIVLIGVTASSVKDREITGAVPLPNSNRGYINGVEVHAHMISQLLSTVLDDRPLLQSWSEAGEYLWIVIWGILGMSVGMVMRSPWRSTVVLGLLTGALLVSSYGLLLLGWWVPFVPVMLILALNGTGLVIGLFYRAEQILERQLVLEELFTEIHNRPLQTLKVLQRELPDHLVSDSSLPDSLKQVDEELRTVYNSARQDLVRQSNRLRLGSNRDLDLRSPLAQLLHDVYCTTMERDFPGFKTLKVKIVEFEPMDDRHLSLARKRGLCRFLEEALCNVGKYASTATRLEITCKQEDGRQVIRVVDNGVGVEQTKGQDSKSAGFGTQQAKNLAKQLKGKFRRFPKHPQGTVCELTWSATRVAYFSSLLRQITSVLSRRGSL